MDIICIAPGTPRIHGRKKATLPDWALVVGWSPVQLGVVRGSIGKAVGWHLSFWTPKKWRKLEEKRFRISKTYVDFFRFNLLGILGMMGHYGDFTGHEFMTFTKSNYGGLHHMSLHFIRFHCIINPCWNCHVYTCTHKQYMYISSRNLRKEDWWWIYLNIIQAQHNVAWTQTRHTNQTPQYKMVSSALKSCDLAFAMQLACNLCIDVDETADFLANQEISRQWKTPTETHSNYFTPAKLMLGFDATSL